MTACPLRKSVTNDTTRIRRMPPEYSVDTRKMPRIDLAALLVETGAHAPFVGFIPHERMERKATRRGVPRYQPPMFARLFAAARFCYPGLFARLRLFVMLEVLARGVPYEGVVRDEPPPDERFMSTPPPASASASDSEDEACPATRRVPHAWAAATIAGL